MMKTVSVRDVSKRFMLRQSRPRNVADGLRGLFSRNHHEEFWAVRDVSFDVQQGEAVGIIGRNGAGKSTMLKLLTGIMEPTEGDIRTRGRVSALIEVGAGFHPEMTGRENVYLNGSILGMTRREIVRKFDDIVAFADLEKFLDTPVKRYSSGMYARLGFAVAAHLDPALLLVDEVLSVGDGAFQDKCAAHMTRLRERGTTILFVSHNLSAVSAICDRVVVMDHGRVHVISDPVSATAAYRELIARSERAVCSVDDRTSQPVHSPLVITGVVSRSSCGEMWEARAGDAWHVTVSYSCETAIQSPEFGFKLLNARGLEVARPSTVDYGLEFPASPGTGEVTFSVDRLPLQPGTYTVSVFAYDRTGKRAYDELNHIYTLTVIPGDQGYRLGTRFGTIVLPGEWQLR